MRSRSEGKTQLTPPTISLMPRTDLLALSSDDLATLANRGLVKRALAELDGGAIEGTPAENAAGTVSVLWSDDAHCLLPANKPLQDAICSCPATGICRHLVRSVLAYQRLHADDVEADEPEIALESAPVAWNPGTFTDDELAKVVSAATLKRARKLWDDGQLVEVATGARPTARFHNLGAHLRFIVPRDARYTHCDCADANCVHVALAVWAFRKLAPDEQSGLIQSNDAPASLPTAELDAIENFCGELCSVGIAGAGQPILDKLARLERELRGAQLIWPAEIALELIQQIEWHRAHNARFESERIAQLVGEWLARADAMRAQSGAVPDVWLRGSASDVAAPIGAARLVGIGTSARFYSGGVELRAFLQDGDSGAVVSVSGDFPDPVATPASQFLRGPHAAPQAATPPQSLAKLGAIPKIKGQSIGAIGAGQLLARGGKRAPSGALSLARAAVTRNAQTFEWEKLRAPLLAESFAEVSAHLSNQAPAFLRARREGENLFVVPLIRAENARFEAATQSVRATLCDDKGGVTALAFPFTARGASGVEALLFALNQAELRFVAGRFARGTEGLSVEPLGLVVQNGATRKLVQPWVQEAPAETSIFAATGDTMNADEDILRDWTNQIAQLLGETWLLGLDGADELSARSWRALSERGASLGFARLVAPVAELADELEAKSRVRIWNAQPARAALLRLSVWILMFRNANK